MAISTAASGQLEIARSFPRERVLVSDGTLLHIRFGRQRVVNPDRPIVRIVALRFTLWRFSPYRTGRWLFLDEDGRSALGLDPTLWPPGHLEALADVLGLAVEHEADVVPGRVLRRRIPGSVTWLEAHAVSAIVVTVLAGSFVGTIL